MIVFTDFLNDRCCFLNTNLKVLEVSQEMRKSVQSQGFLLLLLLLPWMKPSLKVKVRKCIGLGLQVNDMLDPLQPSILILPDPMRPYLLIQPYPWLA
jgi:hypothetical protein